MNLGGRLYRRRCAPSLQVPQHLSFVKVNRSLGGCSRPNGVSRHLQYRRQRQACVAMIHQRVGAPSQADSGFGDPPSLVVIASPRQQLAPEACATQSMPSARGQRVAHSPHIIRRPRRLGRAPGMCGPIARRSRRCRRRVPYAESRCRPSADAARLRLDRHRSARRCLRTARPRVAHAVSRVRSTVRRAESIIRLAAAVRPRNASNTA